VAIEDEDDICSWDCSCSSLAKLPYDEDDDDEDDDGIPSVVDTTSVGIVLF